MIRQLVRSIGGWLVAMCIAGPAAAQFETAAVVGTVRDKPGAVVSDAGVTLTNRDTGVSSTTTTDEAGNFQSSRCGLAATS